MCRENESMLEVSTELLIQSYWNALYLGLDKNFVEMLVCELLRRGIVIK
ncbi:sporulation histidine kinase inhibitor Sda [Paenibacillus sp. NPDC058367]